MPKLNRNGAPEGPKSNQKRPKVLLERQKKEEEEEEEDEEEEETKTKTKKKKKKQKKKKQKKKKKKRKKKKEEEGTQLVAYNTYGSYDPIGSYGLSSFRCPSCSYDSYGL